MTAVSGVKNLRKIQLGREATPGTAVPATTIWRGLAVPIKDDRINVRPNENIGLSSPTTRQYTPGLLASLPFPITEATFQNIQHVMEGGVKTVTPVADGAGSGFINAYPLPSGDSNTTKPYTIESGDNKVVEEMEYSFVVDYELSGKRNEGWMITSTWHGRQAIVSGFTSISIPARPSEMLFNPSKLYIDDVDGTIGGTQITNTWIGAKLKVTTGLKAQPTGDGNLYFSFMDFIGAKAQLELDLLHNAQTAAERVLWRANTPRQIRMLIEGKPLASAGTTYSKETFITDMAGVYTSFSGPEDEDEGSNVSKVVFDCGYDETAALFLNHLLVNELSAVP